jgi:hypothetical protein
MRSCTQRRRRSWSDQLAGRGGPHQRMIYRTFGGDGRRDAVRRAKELRLL